MADRRKLQGEVERCLKKVSEGVETFSDIWKKVYNATNPNQKEKYEADLKKEIKKLQRLRDQIKTWLTSSDIKDKRQLQDARKLIETQMERFKVVERETKTKAYSKEGLGAAQKLDPAQREREEIQIFLTACIDTYNIQVDKFESEIDSINFSLKKKKNDKEKLDRLEDLKQRTSKHKYHVNQLEALLRMLDNGTVEVDQIKKIKDDIEYYRDCSQDPDFQENEFMYVDLDLEDLEDYLAKQQAAFQQNEIDIKNAAAAAAAALDEESSTAVSISPTTTSTNSPSPSPENHSLEEMKVSDSTSTNSVPPSISPTLNNNGTEGGTHVNFHNSQPVINSQTTLYAAAAAGLPNNHYKVSNNHENTWSSSASLEEELNNDVNSNKPFHCPNSSDGLSNHVSKSFAGSGSWTDANSFGGGRYRLPESPPHDEQQRAFSNNDSSSQLLGSDSKNVSNCQNDSRSFSSSGNLSSSNSVILDDAQSSLKNLAERAVLNSGMSNHIHNLQFSALQNKGSQLTHNIFNEDLFIETSKPSPVSTEINVTQIFGTFPQNTYSTEEQQCLKALDVACKRLPLPYDSQRYRYLCPGSPTKTPDYYPQSAPNCNSLDFFQRLSTETLFFIFYFLQGTKAQYLAARTLKTKSWRFHTMFMMWFQRHEEPKTITDDFEQGTYVYFDYEKWVQRKKEGFTFEYKYLEDKDLN